MFKKTTNNYSYIGIGIGIGRYENFDIGILSVSADKEKGIIGPILALVDRKKSLSVYRCLWYSSAWKPKVILMLLSKRFFASVFLVIILSLQLTFWQNQLVL